MAPDKSQGLLLLHDLYQFITDYYNLDEIRTLCFELGINFENITGETRTRKARGLVIQLGLVDPGESCPSKYLELLEIIAVERKAFYRSYLKNWMWRARSNNQRGRIGRSVLCGFGSVYQGDKAIS